MGPVLFVRVTVTPDPGANVNFGEILLNSWRGGAFEPDGIGGGGISPSGTIDLDGSD